MKLHWGEIHQTSEDMAVKHYALHAGQRDVVFSNARFTLASAGTGGGKTVCGPIWIARQITRILQERDCTREPIKGLVVAPTYPILSRATSPELVACFRDTIFEGRYLESRNVYILPNGWGTIYLLSADRPGGIEGGQFDFAWMDEAGQMTYRTWVEVQGRLGMRMGPALLTTTPYTRNWIVFRFIKYQKEGNKDYSVRRWNSISNPAYPVEEYERAKREMTPQRFAMRYEGEFAKFTGLVFPDFSSCIQDFKAPPPGRNFGGVDWGFHPCPFACVAFTREPFLPPNDKMWFWYNRSVRNCLIEEHARAIPKGVHYYGDPENPEAFVQLRKHGHHIQPTLVRSKELQYDAVNERIYSGRMVVHPTLLPLIAEAEEFRWPEEEETTASSRRDQPIGEDHSIDAMCYAIASVDKFKKAVAA